RRKSAAPRCGAPEALVFDQCFFWIPGDFKMLGRNEFVLRRGFAFGKTLVRRKSAAPRCGATEAPATQVLLFRYLEILSGGTQGVQRNGPLPPGAARSFALRRFFPGKRPLRRGWMA